MASLAIIPDPVRVYRLELLPDNSTGKLRRKLHPPAFIVETPRVPLAHKYHILDGGSHTHKSALDACLSTFHLSQPLLSPT